MVSIHKDEEERNLCIDITFDSKSIKSPLEAQVPKPIITRKVIETTK